MNLRELLAAAHEGPWQVSAGEFGEHEVWSPGPKPRSTFICEVSGDRVGDEEAANLIALAPELAEVLLAIFPAWATWAPRTDANYALLERVGKLIDWEVEGQ